MNSQLNPIQLSILAHTAAREDLNYNTPLLLVPDSPITEVEFRTLLLAFFDSYPITQGVVVDHLGVPTICRQDALGWQGEFLSLEPAAFVVEELAKYPLNPYQALFKVCVESDGRQVTQVLLLIHHIISDQQSLDNIVAFFNDPKADVGVRAPFCADIGTPSPALTSRVSDAVVFYQKKGLWHALDRAQQYLAHDYTFHTISLDSEAKHGLYAWCERLNVTPFTVLLTLFKRWVRKVNQREGVIFTPVSGRTPEQQQEIGCFINLLPVVVGSRVLTSLDADIRQTQDDMLETIDFADVPFSRLLEHTGDAPMEIRYVFSVSEKTQVPKSASWRAEDADVMSSSFFAENHCFNIDGEGIQIHFSTRCNHKSEYGQALQAFFQCALTGRGEDASKIQRCLSSLPGETVALEATTTLLEQVFSHAGYRPAITDVDGSSISYKQLQERVFIYRNAMLDAGVREGDVVSVSLERSASQIATMLAIWSIKATYLPLATNLPPLRAATILAEVLPKLAVDQHWIAEVQQVTEGNSIAYPDLPLEALNSSDAPAYLIYTSGTSGKPKGVSVSLKSLGRVITCYVRMNGVTGSDKTLQLASMSFDAFFLDTLPVLSQGGELIIVPDEIKEDIGALLDLLRQESITHQFLVTPLFNKFWHKINTSQNLLRSLAVGGASLVTHQMDTCEVLNFYGPTEATIAATCARTSPSLAPTIGQSLDGNHIYLLDDDLNPVMKGYPGEICIGGVNLALGYYNNPAETARRFVPNPFGDGVRLYRTGDIGMIDASGNLVYVGRNDEQLVLRGYRIEPAEIISALSQGFQVEYAKVKQTEQDTIALYIKFKSNIQVPKSAIIEQLKQMLPLWMLPSHIYVDGELTKTVNGKIDDNHFMVTAKPLVESSSVSQSVNDDLLHIVCQVWRDIFNVDHIGLDADFFELGGNSLHAIYLKSKLSDLFGIDVPVRAIYGNTMAVDYSNAIYAMLIGVENEQHN